MQVAVPLFPRMTALDAIGPYEVLQRVPDIDVVFVGERRGEVRTENGMLGLSVDATFADIPSPDVVVVPGGIGSRALLAGGPLVDWVRAAHPGTRFTTSVCSGALVLGAAGLLDGLTATTHWGAFDVLARFGATPVTQRVVEHLPERIVTAAGVSAGIDMALRLLELLVDDVAAQAAQVFIEYDPQPPFDAGHPSKVSDEVRARLAEYRTVRS
ncbi:DJ-1/PfpI family protein [Pseudonocardia benzenivorans]|jgi:transcriptional regulator GlxA family with amidase domain|uniref:ThiJ/PfpI domain-containing protein n=2 Tax=Pseudonocardia TaxID=1847 RepID=F4CIR3_PSEUX|nr:DJ-1/PfpI family protein [Pseudonocardia dioxanivorans]AEA22658.1 ThiJ/PfpI domain-containing protein [Pseudonocardia dioxanivorans CB1190]